MSDLCPEDRLADIIATIQNEAAGASDQVSELCNEYPSDARLHFLLGSVLAGEGRHIEGYQSLKRAVVLDPDFILARFQLGFLQLTSGEADAALETWGRLDGLPDGHFIRSFVEGLRCLIRDDFAGAIANLTAGVEANDEVAPLSDDMQLIIQKCEEILGSPDGAENGEVSETSILLGQHFTSDRKH